MSSVWIARAGFLYRIAGLRNQYVWPLTARILHSLPGKFCPVIPEQIAKTGIFREKKVNNFKARDKGQSLGKGEAVSSILPAAVRSSCTIASVPL